jgi:hypothetical protein
VIANVGALRIDGDSAFLLFNGAQGLDYLISLAEKTAGGKSPRSRPGLLVDECLRHSTQCRLRADAPATRSAVSWPR